MHYLDFINLGERKLIIEILKKERQITCFIYLFQKNRYALKAIYAVICGKFLDILNDDILERYKQTPLNTQ